MVHKVEHVLSAKKLRFNYSVDRVELRLRDKQKRQRKIVLVSRPLIPTNYRNRQPSSVFHFPLLFFVFYVKLLCSLVIKPRNDI